MNLHKAFPSKMTPAQMAYYKSITIFIVAMLLKNMHHFIVVLHKILLNVLPIRLVVFCLHASNCRSQRGQRGATLLEVMLVVLLLGVLLSVTVPISFRFYNTQRQTEVVRTVQNTLRMAQLKAQYDIHNSAIGVKILPSQIVLFQGDSYALRTASLDEITQFDPPLTLSDDDEVVFARKSGVPVAETTLSFAQNTSTSTIVVSASGLVDKQH